LFFFCFFFFGFFFLFFVFCCFFFLKEYLWVLWFWIKNIFFKYIEITNVACVLKQWCTFISSAMLEMKFVHWAHYNGMYCCVSFCGKYNLRVSKGKGVYKNQVSINFSLRVLGPLYFFFYDEHTPNSYISKWYNSLF
jgi:hypothetical protein